MPTYLCKFSHKIPLPCSTDLFIRVQSRHLSHLLPTPITLECDVQSLYILQQLSSIGFMPVDVHVRAVGFGTGGREDFLICGL